MEKVNKELCGVIKKMTLEEIASIFIVEEKPNNQVSDKIESSPSKILYSINDLLEIYPFFTRYNINKAIQNDGLPFCFIGNKRYFNKEEIDKWIENETKPKKEKEKYDI